MPSPKIIAHRGASGDAPENSIAAFQLAWDCGADGIELDCHLSSDGVPMVIHDADTERTAGMKLQIRNTPANRLSQLDIGAWKHARYQGETIPTLSEVFAAAPPDRYIFIELKSPNPAQLAQSVADLVRQLPALQPFIYAISFDPSLLHAYHSALTNAQSMLLLSEGAPLQGPWQGIGFSRRYRFTQKMLSELRNNKTLLSVWTVNHRHSVGKFFRLGFDFITTDYPLKALHYTLGALPRPQP